MVGDFFSRQEKLIGKKRTWSGLRRIGTIWKGEGETASQFKEFQRFLQNRLERTKITAWYFYRIWKSSKYFRWQRHKKHHLRAECIVQLSVCTWRNWRPQSLTVSPGATPTNVSRNGSARGGAPGPDTRLLLCLLPGLLEPSWAAGLPVVSSQKVLRSFQQAIDQE